jgi:single-strand DNA-binding protein
MINKVILIGNLGRKPSLKESATGVKIANFPLATGERRKDTNGEWQEVTTWHNVVVFGSNAENAEKYLDKGSKIYVEGKIENQKYEKDGEVKYSTQIVGQLVKFLSKKEESTPLPSVLSSSAAFSQQGSLAGSGFDDDDMPF